MTVNKVQVRQKFGQNAATYDEYAVIQKEMAWELLTKTRNTGRSFRRILEIGCGTGFLTELLAREYPQARITAIDIAPEMVELAKEKLLYLPNIEYRVADGENMHIANDETPASLSFDLIVSNAVFQWFADYAKAFAQYHSLLNPGGHLIFSTLGAGTFKELYVCLRNNPKGKIKHEPGCHKGRKEREPFVERKFLLEVLQNSGFQLTGIEEVTKQEHFASCRDFLRALKKIGANNHLSEELVVQGGGSGIFSLIKRYDSMFMGEQGVPATYECLFGWGRRGLPPD